MKKFFALIPMFMLCLFSKGAETETTLMDAYQIYVTAENGKTGSTAELVLNMKNRTAINTWRCTLVLPNGVEFREVSLLYDRIPDGYNPNLQTQRNNDGTISFICSGEETYSIAGGDGAVAVVTVFIDKTVVPKDYDVTIKGTSFIEPGGGMPSDPKERVWTWTIEKGVEDGTLTFDLGGAPGEYAPITEPVGEAIDAPEDPEWEGHKFLGWYPAIPDVMPQGGLTVTAQWEILKFNVFVDGDGVQVENSEPEWGGTVVIFVESFPDRVLEALFVNQLDVKDMMEGNTYTINNVQSDIYVKAIFKSTSETITITQDYTPFSSEYDLNFNDSDLKAYIASGFNKATNQAVLVRVTDVPAKTGVLLIGKVGETYTIPLGQTSSYYVNLFKPFVEEGWLNPYGDDGASVNFVFSVLNDEPGFYSILFNENIPDATPNGYRLPANSAYLQLPREFAEAAVKIGFIFEEDVIDGINNVDASKADGFIYNIAGQRIQKMQKGINIMNGKKILK